VRRRYVLAKPERLHVGHVDGQASLASVEVDKQVFDLACFKPSQE
jgi:hypothetical protein